MSKKVLGAKSKWAKVSSGFPLPPQIPISSPQQWCLITSLSSVSDKET